MHRISQSPRIHPITGRAMHLVDAENLFGLEHGQQVPRDADLLYRTVAHVGPTDLLRIAVDESRWMTTKYAFAGAEVRPGRGTDGADRVLIEGTDLELIARRFDTLVIGSGDHAFIDIAYRARVLGLRIVVVSRPHSLSRRLTPHADEVIDVPADLATILHTRAA